MNLVLHIPTLEEYSYEQKLLSDELTMSYNKGWDVEYFGYNKETGTIDFPKDKWEDKLNKRKSKDIFFAYLKDETTNSFVGYVNYNREKEKASCGIVIESSKRGNNYSKEGLKLLIEQAKKDNIKYLYDDFEEGRSGTKVFFDLGFEIINEYNTKRFNEEIKIIEVRKEISNKNI